MADVLALFDQYHDMVYRLALSCTRSRQDAEDVVQTVFLKLLDGKSPPPQPGKERAWLAQVTVNTCRDLLRTKRMGGFYGQQQKKSPPDSGCDRGVRQIGRAHV